MKKLMVASVALLALSLAGRIGELAAQQAQTPTRQDNPAEFTRVAEEAIDRVCASCHGWDVIGGKRRTVDEWDTVLKEMVAAGARATVSEMGLIRGYVLWSYGRVAVNAASADVLAAVLGIQPQTAQAIVEYRGRHGAFRNADDLAKVPGLDREVLVAQAEALQFDVKEQSR
jgi:competence ComEA-like helix-hairpin-helix protein